MIGKALRFLRPVIAVYCSRRFFALLDELSRIMRAPRLVHLAATRPVPTGIDGPRRPHNGSVLRFRNGWYIAVRTANVHSSRIFRRLTVEGGPANVNSDTWLLCLDPYFRATGAVRLRDESVRSPDGIAKNGLSDARLFAWRDEMWAIWSAERVLGEDWSDTANTMVLGRIQDGTIMELQPLPSPHHLRREKNWMPWVMGDTLRIVYMPANLEVYAVEPDGLRLVRTLPAPDPRLRGYSGGSQVQPWRDDWLCVVHAAARTVRTGSAQLLPSFYLHRFVVLTSACEIRAVSREFFFERRGTEFCAGLAVDGDAVVVSYGVDDAASRVMRLSRQAVEQLLS